jgi:hypothetical protein
MGELRYETFEYRASQKTENIPSIPAVHPTPVKHSLEILGEQPPSLSRQTFRDEDGHDNNPKPSM